VTLMLASLTGSLVGVSCCRGARTMKYAVAVWLLSRGRRVIAAAAGPALLDWYLGFF